MSSDGPEDNKQPISLDSAKVLHADPEAASRALLEETLGEIGFREIEACATFDQFKSKLEGGKPDLLFVDIDSERDLACATIRAVRNQEVGSIPFVVIVALTQKPELEAVQAALEAGSDDMVVKPVTARALHQRVTNQIEDRKEFIATDDYVGPDRRRENGELTEGDPDSIQVPNSLRHATTGDETAAPTEERVKETLRSLSVQKFYHLSCKIGRIAGQQRDLLADNAKSVDCGPAMQEISAALVEVDEIIGEQAFRSVEQVVSSTRRALADIMTCGTDITSRHLDLLCVHGGSIGVVLKESDESAGVLVSALEKAVLVVTVTPDGAEAGGAAEDKSGAPAARPAAAPGPTQPTPDAPSGEPAPAQGDKIPLKVRLLAWWEGVDPRDLVAGAQK